MRALIDAYGTKLRAVIVLDGIPRRITSPRKLWFAKAGRSIRAGRSQAGGFRDG